MLLFYMAFASMASTAAMGKALISSKNMVFIGLKRHAMVRIREDEAKRPRSNRTASTMRKKSNQDSFRGLSSTSRLVSPPVSSPHHHRSINTSNEGINAGKPTTSTVQYHCFSYPGAPAMDRSEIFEVKGKSFKSDGCWRDNRDRAIEKLEGKHPLLRESDYRSRVNALMKCAEVALAKKLPMFALQNGGQCFGGIDTGKTFRKYGPSTACCGDGEGGPWSNEVYSFLTDKKKPIADGSFHSWSSWSSWSPCPQGCHTGKNIVVQLRNRTCSASPGLPQGCHTSMETRPCQVQVCSGSGRSHEKLGSEKARSDHAAPPKTKENDNERKFGEISDKGGMKKKWRSSYRSNKTTTEVSDKGEVSNWVQSRNANKFHGYTERKEKNRRKHLSAAILDGINTLKGKKHEERILHGTKILQNKCGILFLPYGKFTILRGESPKGVAFLMSLRDHVSTRTGGGRRGFLSQSTRAENVEAVAHAIPRRGTLGRGKGTADADNRNWEDLDIPGVSFKGDPELLDGYPRNVGKVTYKKIGNKSDATRERVVEQQPDSFLSRGAKLKDIYTRFYTDRPNSQRYQQWMGALKAKFAGAFNGNPVSIINESLRAEKLIRGPLAKDKNKTFKTSVFPEPVALYPLSAKYRARDVIGGNMPGIINDVVPASGPFNQSGNSLSFLGTPNSYIEFPNNGQLEMNASLTLLAWILPRHPGPIFNYKTDGWRVALWISKPKKLLARFISRGQKGAQKLLTVKSSHIIPNKWNFVGAIYHQNTGRASLWIDGKLEDTKSIGNITLATKHSVRMGARIGDERNFRGRISCMQVYDVALTPRQINNAQWKCRSLESVFRGKIKNNRPAEIRDQHWD